MTWEELNAVRRLNEDLENAQRQLAALKRTNLFGGSAFDGLPKSKFASSRVENLAIRIADTESEIADLRLKFVEAAALLEEKICSLTKDDTARKILIFRYVDCMYFRDIGFVMGFSESRVYYVHNQICGELLEDF